MKFISSTVVAALATTVATMASSVSADLPASGAKSRKRKLYLDGSVPGKVGKAGPNLCEGDDPVQRAVLITDLVNMQGVITTPTWRSLGLLDGQPGVSENDLATFGNGGDDGAVQQQLEEPPLSPVRRTNVNQIDPTKIPSDSMIFSLSQTLLLDSKNGQKSPTVDFLMPPNKQHHRQAPPHFVGWDEDDFDWRDVVLALYVWNRLMTLEQRQRELKKSQKLGPPGREKYKRKIKQLHEDRPTTVADIADPNANNSTALVPARRSTRTVQNAARAAEAVDAQALAELVEHAQEYSSDPGRQERARQRATGQVGQRGGRVTPPSNPTPVDAVEIVGMGSTEEERSERVQQRVSNRNKWKRRRQGTNCTSLGMQGDAQALTMVNSFHETAGKTVETLHFPQLSEGQPSHAVMSVSYNEFDVYNSGGGRTVNSGRRAEKPRLTITADNRASVCSLVRQLAGALSRTRDKEATSGTYELDDFILECNFKDTASPLHEAVRRRNDTFRGEHLSRPSTNRESNDQIQRRIPSSIEYYCWCRHVTGCPRPSPHGRC